jgi:hypothetical protein
MHGLKDPWRAPESLLRKADIVVDENGIRTKDAKGDSP